MNHGGKKIMDNMKNIETEGDLLSVLWKAGWIRGEELDHVINARIRRRIMDMECVKYG